MASNSKNIAELLNGDVTIEAVDIATGAVTGAKLSNNFNYDSGTLYLDSTNNRVGIGTTSPSSIFHTEENTTSASIVRHKNTSNTSGAHSRLIIQNGGTSGGDTIINLDSQTSGSRFTLGVDNSANKFVIANADKGSFDGSNEAMVIDSSGNVGIGTGSPSSKLHVNGSFRQTGATAPFEWTVNAGALDYYKLNAVGYADNLIVANSGGKVGISTVNPAEKLSVNGNIRLQSGNNPTRIEYFNSTGSYNLGVSGGAAIAFHDTAGSQEISFETHYTGNYHREVMRLDKFGNHTVPHQPAFWAYLSGNWTGWTPNNQTQVVPFNAEYHDIGGNFNTSNGLFTCPVAGEYIFTAGVYVGVTSVEQIWLVKAGGRSITFGFPNAGTTGDRIVGSVVIRCSANDTIGICPYANSGTTSTVFANFHHTFFLGALIN